MQLRREKRSKVTPLWRRDRNQSLFVSSAMLSLMQGVAQKTFHRVEISFTEVRESRGKESYKVIIQSNNFFYNFGANWIKPFWKNTNTFLCPQEKVEYSIYLVLVLRLMGFCLRTDRINFVRTQLFFFDVWKEQGINQMKNTWRDL